MFGLGIELYVECSRCKKEKPIELLYGYGDDWLCDTLRLCKKCLEKFV